MNFSCGPDITPAYLIITEEDFLNCVDISNFNNTHEQNYDQKELDAIRQHSFRDVLVSLNGQELGYWKLPCTIPLLPEYTKQNYIRVTPCVRLTDKTTTTTQYHFVTLVEEFFEFSKEGEYRLSPFKLEYVPSVNFPVLETFEQSTIFKPRISEFPATIEIENDTDLQKKVGKVSLTDTAVFFDIVTPYFPLLGGGERQFWEISYKSINGQMNTHLGFEGSILLGMTNFDMIVLPSTKGKWKKIYIEISEIVSQASFTVPQISTRLRISGLKEREESDAEFYFENIKLITMSAPYH